MRMSESSAVLRVPGDSRMGVHFLGFLVVAKLEGTVALLLVLYGGRRHGPVCTEVEMEQGAAMDCKENQRSKNCSGAWWRWLCSVRVRMCTSHEVTTKLFIEAYLYSLHMVNCVGRDLHFRVLEVRWRRLTYSKDLSLSRRLVVGSRCTRKLEVPQLSLSFCMHIGLHDNSHSISGCREQEPASTHCLLYPSPGQKNFVEVVASMAA